MNRDDEHGTPTIERELTEKQRRFVELYMGERVGNATRAYMDAYGEQDPNAAASHASALVRVRKVRDAIAARVEADPLVATRHEVLRRLSCVVRGEVDGSRVADEIRAAELLLKVQGELVDRHAIAVSNDKPAYPLTDEELIAKAKALYARHEVTP